LIVLLCLFYCTGMVSDIYATLNATHFLRNISVEIHSMYTTNLARIIR
jgi:hypothetical protein